MKIEKRTSMKITELGAVVRKVETDGESVRIGFSMPGGTVATTGYMDSDDVDALILALQEVRAVTPTAAAGGAALLRDVGGDMWRKLPNGRWGIDSNHRHRTCGSRCGLPLGEVRESYGPLTEVKPQ